jgi:hypothetical protein
MTGITKTDTAYKGRFYTLPDGRKYPSVTTILSVIGKPALINWAANVEREMVVEAAANLYEDLPIDGKTPKMSRAGYVATLQERIGKTKAHTKELAKAGDIGTQAHALIEWNIRKSLGQEVGPEPKISEKATWAFMVWQEWAKSVNFKPIFCEQAIYSHEHRYAGTMDLTAEVQIEGKIITVVADWKTGKAIYDEALLQNAAYIEALLEMGHLKAPLHGLIVRLPKNEKDPEPETRLIDWSEHEKLFRIFKHVRALWGWQFENGNGKH